MEETTQPKLTKKSEAFVNQYIETGDKKEAALKVFDTTDPNVANTIANEYLKKPLIIEAISQKRKSLKQALLDQGIDEDYIAEKVDVLLTATDKDGNPDYTAIDKGLKHATVLHGVVDPDDKPKQTSTTYNFIFSAPVQEKVRVLEAEIKDMLTKKPDVQTN